MPLAAAIPYVAAAASAYGAVKQGQASDAATKAANQPAPQVNVDQVNQQAQALAKSNAEASQALQDQLNPGVSQLRSQSIQQLISALQNQGIPQATQVNQGGTIQDAINALQGRLGGNTLLNNAATAAQGQLDQGGNLPLDVRNLVARTAAARAGAFSGPGGGLGAGRDITARDLGLTSLDLLNQRIGNAASVGGQQGAYQNSVASLLGSLGSQQYQNDLAGNSQFFNQQLAGAGQNFSNIFNTAQFGQNIQYPNVGLDPAAVANIYGANLTAESAKNASAANVAGAQSQGYGQLAGQGLGALASYYGSKT